MYGKADEYESVAGKNCFQRFGRRCGGLVKEQRARFYILRRCITMLVCWKDCTDS